MSVPIENLTPKQIVSELNKYIIGQDSAKKAVAVAIRNRFRRQQLPETDRDDILPKNILMIGPTGVGKTELARRVAQLVKAPFIKIEATKFTEVGYVGRDVESMIRDLVSVAARLVEKEMMDQVQPEAEKKAIEKLVDLLEEKYISSESQKEHSEQFFNNSQMKQALEFLGPKFEQDVQKYFIDFSSEKEKSDEGEQETKKQTNSDLQKKRKKLIKEILAGKHNNREIELETDEQSPSFLQVFTPHGMEEMGLEGGSSNNPFSFMKKGSKIMKVSDALKFLTDQEAKKMVDQSSITREAILRTEQTAIIFLDEIDKIAMKRSGSSGPDVSREGVQRDLLPIIEGSTVATKYGPVKTDHILFITAGAFHTSKPSDLIPELQGRLPIRVELETLNEEDFKKILKEPKNALIKQYQQLLEVEGIQLDYSETAIDRIAHFAQEVNTRTENIGARRLHTLLEKVLEDLLFDAPDNTEKKILIDEHFVENKLKDLVQDTDLSRYIL